MEGEPTSLYLEIPQIVLLKKDRAEIGHFEVASY